MFPIKKYFFCQDEFRRTPLYYAAAYGHTSTAELLIKSGARKNGLDRDGWTALHAAARHGQVEAVRFVITFF